MFIDYNNTNFVISILVSFHSCSIYIFCSKSYSLIIYKCNLSVKVMKPLLCLNAVKEPKYFSLKELCKTDTGLDNFPNNFTCVNNLRVLSSVLDTFREESQTAIVVNSGYRSPEVNRKVGGVSTSLHQFGRAADIRPLIHNERNWHSLVVVVKRYEHILSEVIYHENYIHLAI